LVANVSDQFKNQFIIEIILIINLEINYNFFGTILVVNLVIIVTNYFLSLKLFTIQRFYCSML